VSLYPGSGPGGDAAGGPPPPDRFDPGRPCPGCRGVATFLDRQPGEDPVLVCTDCVTGAFDTTWADPLPPPFRVRLLGWLPGGTVAVFEYGLDPPG
jgi:hypothetical protein